MSSSPSEAITAAQTAQTPTTRPSLMKFSRGATALKTSRAIAQRLASKSGSRLPWDAYIARNAIASRTFIETVGYYSWSIALSRNKFEAAERVMDIGMWYVAALILPILGHTIQRTYFRNVLRPQFKLKNKAAFLTPFEQLSGTAIKRASQQKALAKAWGLASTRNIPKIAQAVLLGKVLIIASNLLLMAAKGQLYFNVRNKITEKASGKEGFSGVLELANEEYLKKNAAEHKKKEKLKHILSIALGFGGALGFPLLLYYGAKSGSRTGVAGRIKRMLPAFNYNNAVHMPKWVLLVHNIFNWAAPGLFASRDKNELIERGANIAAYDLFYFVGDDIISGTTAKILNAKYKRQLKGFSLIKRAHKLTGIPLAKSYPEMLALYDAGKAPRLAVNLARQCFWTGIAGTALILGISTTLLNNYFTKQRLAKQNALKSQQ